jgi:hypothetical protein
MVKLLTILLFTLLSFTTTGAAPFDIVYAEKTSGAEGFASIDPLVNGTAQHAGFIYSDRSTRRLVIDDFSQDSTVTIGLSGAPEKSIHYYNPGRDTLFVVSLLSQAEQMPKIAFVSLSGNTFSMRVIPTDCFSGYGSLAGIESQDIRLKVNPGGTVDGIWFEATLRYEEDLPGFGSSSETHATTILYSRDFENILLRENVSSLVGGNVFGDEGIELLGFTNYDYDYDFRQSGDDSAVGGYRIGTFVARDSSAISVIEHSVQQGTTRAMLIGDFDPSSKLEEVILAGEMDDLEGLGQEVSSHVACYSLADETITKLWQLEDSLISPNHIYRDREIVVGTTRPDQVIFLNYLTGQVTDSVNLGRELTAIRFFETYSNPSTLNLTGRLADTVFVYRFDISTQSAFVQADETTPATFSLHRNHPNPFNGETRLSFDNEVSQYLALKIYNILGQEVTTLAEGVYSPGTYYAYWNGADIGGIMQSSGVYFAKLQADNASQIIKLIFLK